MSSGHPNEYRNQSTATNSVLTTTTNGKKKQRKNQMYG